MLSVAYSFWHYPSLSFTEFAQVLPALPPHNPQDIEALPLGSILRFRLSAGVSCRAKKLIILFIVCIGKFLLADKSLALATPTNVPPFLDSGAFLLLSKATRAASATAFGGIGMLFNTMLIIISIVKSRTF